MVGQAAKTPSLASEAAPVEAPLPAVPPAESPNPAERHASCDLQGQEVVNTGPREKVARLTPFERNTLILAWAGFLTAVLTGIVFYLQFREMKRQTGILNGQAQEAAKDSNAAAEKVERQLRIAQEQASAAQDGVSAIRRQMRQDQRAWLRVDVGTVIYAQPGPASVPVTITNTGKTPAREVTEQIVVEKVKNTENLHFSYRVPRTVGTMGMLYPNALQQGIASTLAEARGTQIVPPAALSAADMQELLAGEAYLAIYGKITYLDVFGMNHYTKFCVFSSPAPKQVYVTAKKCTDYNSVDGN